MDQDAGMRIEESDQKIADEKSFLELGSTGRTAVGPKQNKQGHRRKRTAFTARQLERMQAVFQWNKYPGVTVREALASELGISEASVQVWFQNRRSKWRKREHNKRPTHRGKESDACSFYTHNTAQRSWMHPQAHSYYSRQINSQTMFGTAPVSATLMPAGSPVHNPLITCASFYSTHVQPYDQEKDEKYAEQIDQTPLMLKSGDASMKYIDLDQVPKVKFEAIQRQHSADEIIGPNGLLCMRGTSSTSMSSK